MVPDLTNLLLSLAVAIADAPASGGAAVGTDLFVHSSPVGEPGASAVAVLRIYGGPTPEAMYRIPAASVQCMVTAETSGGALDLANRLYEAMHVSGGELDARPRAHWSIDALRLSAAGVIEADDAIDGEAWVIRRLVPLAPPGEIGRDEAGRVQVAFNFDVHFTAPEAA